MKICVLRRDGGDVHHGMLKMVNLTMKEFFGKRELCIHRDEEEFTQMLMFEVEEREQVQIVEFIVEISRLNPLYAVRIIEAY